MVLSDGTTSSLGDVFAEHNPDKKVEYDLKRCCNLLINVNDVEQDTINDFLIHTDKTTGANFAYPTQLDLGFFLPY